ncbi:hypothetical protein [Candidatus Enterococcus mansonii]|uniref:Uncharacterized protein n=1 Tax=Candidatus Enterococcus mansonii TaxID=1834181 RepID=A0A242CD47_9ENTE|nr:hypothetical protein [Enterococcus sp. 4G2_DIV0659]OTO07840.1 hypothetical protein A5880_002110 [Enterococcus sp. 4G2_DIV0659]
MSILEWLFIGSLSLAFLAFLIVVMYIVLFFITGNQLKALLKKRPKNKTKRKKWVRIRRQMEKRKKSYVKKIFFITLIALVSLGGGMYARYYQMTNLNAEDSNAIVQSYFLLGEVEKSLSDIQNGADFKKSKATLADRSSLLASYGTTSPSDVLSKEGQKRLVRYYRQIRDFSVNVYSLTEEELSDSDIMLGYTKDLNQIKKLQEKIFKQFSINESALKQKK